MYHAVIFTGLDVGSRNYFRPLGAYRIRTELEAKGLAVSLANAAALPVTPHGTITATNVQLALQQLADQDFRSTSQPTGTNVQEGDTWYDTDDNLMKVYREVSTGVFAWTNLVVAETDDTLDAGSY